MRYMPRFAKRFLAVLFIVGLHASLYAQSRAAEVRIVNQTNRTLRIKVMQNINQGALKYYDMSVPAGGKGTIGVFQTGTYDLKVKAEYPGREPVFSMGDHFECNVASDASSLLTFTYAIDESAVNTEWKSISQSEFEKDRD